MFCLKPMVRGGREVALYGAYAPIREGMAHVRCFKRYLICKEIERLEKEVKHEKDGNERTNIL